MQTSPRSPKNFAALAPLKMVLAYLILTFAIAALGPIIYVDFAKGRTAMFLFGVSLSIFIGYILGIRSMEGRSRGGAFLTSPQILRVFDISIAIASLALVWSVFSSILSGTLNTSLTNIGDAYIDSYAGYERNSGNYSLTFILYSVSLPFSFIASVLGIFYFTDFSRRRQILTLLLILGGLTFYVVGTGKQKQVGDVLIYLIAIGAVKYGINGKRLSPKLVIRAIFGAVIALAIFVAVLGQRYSALNIDANNINAIVNHRMSFDVEHPIFGLLGPEYGFGLSVFSSYLSQGYYGLSLALDTDWEWTHFSGFSYSLSVILNKFLGFEWQWPNTIVYQVGATTGWGESKWHTIFPHFATDLTWPGTIIIFGFFAFVYARSWLLATRYGNPYAILMFTMMTMGMFFMPANNQLFHSPGLLLTVICVTVLYVRKGHFLVRNSKKARARSSARNLEVAAFPE